MLPSESNTASICCLKDNPILDSMLLINSLLYPVEFLINSNFWAIVILLPASSYISPFDL